jgi:hypothetical protein
MHKYKPFWTKELTNQRNKRDQAWEIAEKSLGKRWRTEKKIFN